MSDEGLRRLLLADGGPLHWETIPTPPPTPRPELEGLRAACAKVHEALKAPRQPVPPPCTIELGELRAMVLHMPLDVTRADTVSTRLASGDVSAEVRDSDGGVLAILEPGETAKWHPMLYDEEQDRMRDVTDADVSDREPVRVKWRRVTT